jgi:hypothetical protein
MRASSVDRRVYGVLKVFVGLVVLSGPGCAGKQSPVKLRGAAPNELLSVADFDAIGDRAARSRALYGEMARVLTHPRCINCHPSGDTPHQLMTMELHEPPVVRGPKNEGVPGMECASCHQDRNQALTRVPGAPNWHLAPIEMAWVGKSLGYICNQIKDPKRNGGKTPAQLIEHNGRDELVAWGWEPGADREPAPGTQEQFGALTAAWFESGAECPEEDP